MEEEGRKIKKREAGSGAIKRKGERAGGGRARCCWFEPWKFDLCPDGPQKSLPFDTHKL